jgi:hypothetical protein
MRRASYEYPLAYGRGYKAFPITRMQMHFHKSRTIAIGDQSTLHAGLVASHTNHSLTSIDYLFRFRGVAAKNSGKILLKQYLEFCLRDRDYEEVGLEVVSRNKLARMLYEAIGFKENGSLKGNGHKLISMQLSPRSAIQQAITHLDAFSV